MIERQPWSVIIRQGVGAIIAVLAVTAASYIWHLAQAQNPQVKLAVYAISITLLLVGAFVIFRRIVRRGYQQDHRLTLLPFFLQILIWGLFFAFPCIYNPYNWAWSQSYTSQVIPFLGVLGWACEGIGLVILVLSMAWLGWPRSIGWEARRLETSGVYRFTRNPQLMGGLLLILGYMMLWPSWYDLGWLVLFVTMMHMMVLTEEEHLRCIYGEEYEQYCKQVPRYLGRPRK